MLTFVFFNVEGGAKEGNWTGMLNYWDNFLGLSLNHFFQNAVRKSFIKITRSIHFSWEAFEIKVISFKTAIKMGPETPN